MKLNLRQLTQEIPVELEQEIELDVLRDTVEEKMDNLASAFFQPVNIRYKDGEIVCCASNGRRAWFQISPLFDIQACVS